jgi:hypothetical protein
LICPIAYSFTDYDNWGKLQNIQFFKPRGADYGRADKGNNFCFADLVGFGMVNGVKIANEMSEIEQYMTDFKRSIDSQKKIIDEIIEAKEKFVILNPSGIESKIEITEPKNNKEMTYIELIKMSLSAIPYIAPYVQKWTEKMTEGLAEDMYQYGKELFVKDPKKLQLLKDAKDKQLTKEETTEFQEIAVEIAETQETKAILQKYIPENMTYNDFKKLIEKEPKLSIAFDALDILEPKMGFYEAEYKGYKNDVLADKFGLLTEINRERLKMFAKKFLA